MKILIVGATGGTGRAVTTQAIARDHDVTVLIRDPEQTRDLPARLDTVVGDVRNPDTVSRALHGVDAVVSCLGVRRGQSPGTVRSDGTRTLVDRVAASGVRRLVVVSTVGVGDSVAAQSRPARLLWPRIIGPDRLADAARAETFVRDSALDWTLVRPPRLVDAPVTGEVEVGPNVPTRFGSQISRADLARTLLDLIDGDQWNRAAVTAVGVRTPGRR